MPIVTFDFRARNADSVRKSMQSVLDGAGNGRAGTARQASAEQATTRATLRELAARTRARDKAANDARRAAERETAGVVREAGKREKASERETAKKLRDFDKLTREANRMEESMTRAAERGAQRRAAAEQRARSRAGVRAERQREQDRTRHGEILHDAAQGARRAVVGGVRGVANFTRNVAGAVGEYGDTVRDRFLRSQALTERATAIASGDIGVTGAAGRPVVAQLLQATRAGAERGFSPEDVLEALGRAQSDFSSLGTAGDRSTYIDRVLPQLMNAALATGGSLTDMVGMGGEMSRQHGISLEDLPQRIAAAIAQGRMGSISGRDFASHGGVLGGAASAFMGSGGEAGRNAFATTSALFQVAGRAGGGGDLAATRAGGFLRNFSSAAGQERLTRAIGHNVLDASGQIITNRGESQSDALMRVLEEAYRDTRGNAAAFNTAVGGNDSRSQQLAQQLFNDLRSNNGRLTGTRAILGAGRDATAAGVQGAAAQDVLATEGAQRRIRENREFYAATSGPGGVTDNFALETQRTMDDLRSSNPFIASLLDTTVARGAMDLTGIVNTRSDPHRLMTASGPMQSRGDLVRSIAQRRAASGLAEQQSGIFGTIVGALTPESMQREMLRAATDRIEGEINATQAGQGRSASTQLRTPDPAAVAPIRLAEGTTVNLSPASIAAIGVAAAAATPQLADHATTLGRTLLAAERNRL